eukprot:CAMPEP_0174705612 /NCGR_PEP_ID=MMETSP1094-20130205/8772_1 /TAXON_ID=156173 /ORGANISM="Chrysochromulina brevifilum, Strain UTEX LB 985" /LENGTH=664 /DNA_ID=CAMNT_0015903807 /DNA_START=139 /DNA_END=2133 /DNA_ORIENTATION=+
MPLLDATEQKEDPMPTKGEVVTITLSRTESGLGMVFDTSNVVTKLLPGCAAAEHGGVRVGDQLLAVDGVAVQPGDRVGALFPMGVNQFELRLLRRNADEISRDTPATVSSASKPHLSHAERVAARREQSGKFEPGRPAPVFQEVVWNEYCVLFPDGSSAPFQEAVRYTALTGYLRKKRVVRDGCAEFSLAHGESQRGWVRHYFHLTMKQLAWFDEDPQEANERQRGVAGSKDWLLKLREAAKTLKKDYSTGKGVGSALLYTAPCRLFTSRLYRNMFALSYGDGSLLTMQAADGKDAQQWVVAIASCLYFSSAAFEAVLAECQRFFDASNKTVEGKLSPIEALDLVRAMGRQVTYPQVMKAAATVIPNGAGWFGPREFTYLVRNVCEGADPRSELLRAFRLLDTSEGGKDYVHVVELTAVMRAAGVPDEHVLLIMRAAGVGEAADQIPYLRLADTLYPAAATAAKRRRTLQGQEEAETLAAELEAREAWAVQREEIVHAAQCASPGGTLPVLLTLRNSTAGSVPYALQLGMSTPPPAASGSDGAPAMLRFTGSTGSLRPETPRSQEIVRSLSAGHIGPATPRTIADRVGRARRASSQTDKKSRLCSSSSSDSFSSSSMGSGRLSVPLGSPSRVPLPAEDQLADANGTSTPPRAARPELSGHQSRI